MDVMAGTVFVLMPIIVYLRSDTSLRGGTYKVERISKRIDVEARRYLD